MEKLYPDKTILFVGQGLGKSGSEKMFRFAIDSIAPLFGKAVILADDASSHREYARSGIETIDFSDCGIRLHTSGLKAKLERLSNTKKAIGSIIDRYDADVCLAFTGFIMIAASRAMKSRKNVLLLGSERGTPGTKSAIFRFNMRRALPRFDSLSLQTDKVRNFYTENQKVPEDKSRVIPNPFVPTETEICPAEERQPVIVSAGRLCAAKNFGLLIDAFRKVYDKHPEYKLVIYGEGPDRGILQAKADNSGITDKISLAGFVPNITEAIRNASVFVLSSREEGIPNSLLEAMGVGLPCVSTDCASGGPALLFGEDRGLLVGLTDADEMADAICRIIEDNELARSLSEKATAVRDLFSPEKIALSWRSFVTDNMK